MLRREYYYTGIHKATWEGKTYEIPVPVMVDAETARLVNERRARYHRYPAGNLKVQVLGAGSVYCQACGTRMVVENHQVTYKRRKYSYLYYRCPYDLGDMEPPGCAKHVNANKIDLDLWERVWGRISDPEKFEATIRGRIAELQAQECDAEAECTRLQARLEEIEFERQRVITGWRKGKISDDELDTQKAAIWIEESEVKRELADKRLLVSDRAARLVEVARVYRERIVAGVQVNFDPQTAEEKQALFEWRRKVVQGIVQRVEAASDKCIHVSVVLDLEKDLEGEPLLGDLSVSETSAMRVL